jgi:predicted secreted protein
MKSLLTPAIYLIVSVLFALAACKKDAKSNVTLQLTAADSDKTITVANGGKILISLTNPGDGGFNFDNWQYNPSVLKLVNHTRNYPTNSDRIGDFGSDTWQFSAIASGTSTLKITATQSPAYVVTMFRGTVRVK